jgi:hypothetical protein
MADVKLSTVAACVYCGTTSARLDEQGRCERCVLDGEKLAIVFQEFEAVVQELLARGITYDELVQLMMLTAENREGVVANVPRRRVATREVGLWEQYPISSFLEIPDRLPNPLRHLRLLSKLTLEDLAGELGEPPETIALWEQGLEIPGAAAELLGRIFRVLPQYLTGEDA